MAAVSHRHDHDHDHHGHDHHHETVVTDRNRKRVAAAFLLTTATMLVEFIGGWISGSLALIADAGHMLADSAALGLAWIAFLIAGRPADAARSFGYHRFQVVSAFINSATLIGLCLWITFEAILRLFNPEPVMGGTMLAVAIWGLIVNVIAFALLQSGDRTNLNIRGAAAHVLGDLLGSAAAITAALIIMTTGWMPIDPILSLFVVGLIGRSAWKLLRQSTHILMEGTPAEIDLEAIKSDLVENIPHVENVHHVHAWSLTPDRLLVTLHARVDTETGFGAILRAIAQRLADRHNIHHATIQLESDGCIDEVPAKENAAFSAY